MNTLRRSVNDPTLMLLCATLLGCSAGVKATPLGAGGSAGGSVGSGGSGAGGTQGGAGRGGATGSGNTDGGTMGDGMCAGEAVGAVAVPLDLYFLMDSSKSMLDTTGDPTMSKWKAVGLALGNFFTDNGSAGLGVALKYFPDEQPGAPTSCTMDTQCTAGGYGNCDRRQTCTGAGSSTTNVSPLCQNVTTDCPGTNQACALIQQCGTNSYCAAGPNAPAGACTGCTTFPGYCHLRDICTPSKYATPDVALMTLPAGASALSSSLMNHTPDGYTPTGPALAGAISYAKARLASNPDHKVAVVLVTDGLPGGFLPGFPPPECVPSDVNMIASMILAPAATANPPILTFVVGIFNPNSLEGMAAPTNLAALATAGGTGSPVIIDVTQNNVTQQLQDALTVARTKAIACSYQIPQPSHGNLDFMKVNVQFMGSGAANPSTVGKTTGPTACDKGGWYYDSDADPSIKTPTRIIACPSTCADFNKDTGGEVQISLNCVTIMVS